MKSFCDPALMFLHNSTNYVVAEWGWLSLSSMHYIQLYDNSDILYRESLLSIFWFGSIVILLSIINKHLFFFWSPYMVLKSYVTQHIERYRLSEDRVLSYGNTKSKYSPKVDFEISHLESSILYLYVTWKIWCKNRVFM